MSLDKNIIKEIETIVGDDFRSIEIETESDLDNWISNLYSSIDTDLEKILAKVPTNMHDLVYDAVDSVINRISSGF